MTLQVLQEAAGENTSNNFILQERQERKKREALEMTKGMQTASMSEKEIQDSIELEAKRLETLQRSVEWIKQNDEERAKSGGVAPLLSV